MVLRVCLSSCILITGLIIGLDAMAEGRQFYQWVDEHGNVHFSDRLPIGALRDGHRVVDENGLTVEYREPPKSPAELARERAAEAERLKQERKDRELLMTYTDEEQLNYVRDQRLVAADTIIEINTKQLRELQRQLSEVEGRIARRRAADQDIPQALFDDQAALAERAQRKRDYVEQRQAERQRIVDQFAADLARFRELRGHKD